MKKYLAALYLVIFLMLMISGIYGQKAYIDYYSAYYYYAAQEEPPENWFMPEFDDEDWNVDTNSIGFGYDNQRVELNPEAKSLYLRYRFNLANPENVKKMTFSGNFDDGYIAYLNGKEILRVNVADSTQFPAYNDLAIRSHESEYRAHWPVFSYYLDSLLLDSCLVEGQNVIAVHVLNDSINGSDLFFYLRLYNITNYTWNLYMEPFRCFRQTQFDSVNLPLIIINTDEFGIPYKNKRVKAHMGIIDNGKGNYNKPDDSCNVYEGNVSIEVRGQSSSEFPKRSYRFELWDEFDQDTNYSLLGMPANDDWILLGPYQDKAHFRNSLIFDLARRFGRYQPRTAYCELILNGNYLGLYVLVETIKRSPGRLNLARLRPSEISGNDVTGGYIMKYDKPRGLMQIVYPKEDDIAQEQIDYINGFLNEYESVLFTNDFMDPVSGFRKYINDTSLVDHIIMTEFPRDCDGYMYSTYFYKDRADRDNRLTYGPIWDNDLVFGNTIFQEGDSPEGWHFEHNWGTTKIHIVRMLQDRDFVELLQERWKMARNSFLHTDSLFANIDARVNFLAESLDRNYTVWPVIDQYLFQPNYISTSYENEIYNIKNWISDRLDWIDDHINDIFYDVDIYNDVEPVYTERFFGFEVFPVPFTDELQIVFSSSQKAHLRSEIYDVSGQLKFAEEFYIDAGISNINIDNSIIQSLASGVYFMRVIRENELTSVRKIIKH